MMIKLALFFTFIVLCFCVVKIIKLYKIIEYKNKRINFLMNLNPCDFEVTVPSEKYRTIKEAHDDGAVKILISS